MDDACPDFRRTFRPTRRSLLKAGVAGVAGLSLPALLRAEEAGKLRPRAKNIIFLHQFGGPSHIDTFDLKPDAPDGIRGSFKPIASSVPGMNVCEHLPEMAKVMHLFAQVRSVNHGMRNHNSATYYSLTGHNPPIDDIRLRDTQELYPAFGSVAARFRPADDSAVPSSVSFPYVIRDGSVTPGQHASFLGKANDPFLIEQDPNRRSFQLPELTLPGSVTLDRLDDRRGLVRLIDEQGSGLTRQSSLARGIDSFQERAVAMLASDKVKRAFDLSQESKDVRDAYGRTTYGQSCLLARRLVETGVRFVTVYFSKSIGGANGGWDTHADNFNQMKDRLLPLTDRAVPALMRDLQSRGLLDETLVVWMGEFGRTPRITTQAKKNGPDGPDGRSHWPNCYTVLLGGGGVRGGAVYGASDKIGAFPANSPVRPDDIAATMFWALGIDPQTEVHDPLGRPLPIADGRPLDSLFG